MIVSTLTDPLRKDAVIAVGSSGWYSPLAHRQQAICFSGCISPTDLQPELKSMTSTKEPSVSPSTPSINELSDIYALEAIKGFGPQKFKELHVDGLSPSDLLSSSREFQRFGKRGQDFAQQLAANGPSGREEARERAIKQRRSAEAHGGFILTYRDPNYPALLFESNLPVPALYVRGDLSALKPRNAVACVGSRNIRPPYDEAHNAFARQAIEAGWVIVSGFATGADIIGHLAAEKDNGLTIAVMPSGLDRPFPPEHKDIWRRFLEQTGAAFVSEFGFGVGANALNLRKRNKMIAALARGVLVSQSAEDGGAMNAYRFAMEQKKPVATFKNDGTSSTSGNDLIAGSAERVRSRVLSLEDREGWAAWLRTL